ncbi:MAG: hypothetical protein AAGI38_14530 [Bacteroidota bacterium]
MPSTIHIQKKLEYAGHRGSIFAMTTSKDEQWLFTSGDDGVVASWELPTGSIDGKAVFTINKSIYSLCYLEGLNKLVAGASDGTAYLIDLAKKEVTHTYQRSKESIYHLFFHAPSHTIWLLLGKGFLARLDADDFTELSVERLAKDNLRSLVHYPERNALFVGTSDNRIIELDDQYFRPIQHWEAHENSVFSLLVHPDTHLLLSGGRDAYLKAWDLQQQEVAEVRSLPAHNFTINDIALSPSRDYFATASRDKTIKIWDAYSLELLKVIDLLRNQGHKHSVNKLKWLKSDNSLISCGDDRRIIRWELGFS